MVTKYEYQLMVLHDIVIAGQPKEAYFILKLDPLFKAFVSIEPVIFFEI